MIMIKTKIGKFCLVFCVSPSDVGFPFLLCGSAFLRWVLVLLCVSASLRWVLSGRELPLFDCAHNDFGGSVAGGLPAGSKGLTYLRQTSQHARPRRAVGDDLL